MSKTNPKVDDYLSKRETWREELAALRKIILECPVTEEFKWWKPIYAFEGTNLFGLHGMKETCAIAFFKGVLLKDPKGILVRPGENSQSGRWVKFKSLGEIKKLKPVLKAYILESIEAEKAGLKVTLKKITDFKIPEELQKKLDKDPAFNKAYFALTPGRQRGYILHISGAKQSATRESRVEKCTPRILAGKGMQD